MADSQPQEESKAMEADNSFDNLFRLREENERSILTMLGDLTQEVGVIAGRMSHLESTQKEPDSNLVKTSVTSKSPVVVKPSGILKPRDIPLLTLKSLQGLESPARLQMFIEVMERCVEEEQARIEIAKSRMDSELALFIHTAQRSGMVQSWEEVVDYLKSEFNVKINFDQAWRVHEEQHYDWRENPHTFIQSFKCQYAVLQSRFIGEKLPSRDGLIKKKLAQGFPQHSREKLEFFLDKEIPLATFVERVEHERLVLSHQQPLPESAGWNRLELVRNPVQSQQPLTSSQPDPVLEGLENLKQSMEVMKQRLEVLEMRSNVAKYQARTKYCTYCKIPGHELGECKKRPRLGRCFDCDRPNCRRGNPECPGVTTNIPKTRTTQAASSDEL